MPISNNVNSSLTFDKLFFEQTSDIVVFKSLHNKKILQVIATRLFPDHYQDLKKILHIIDSIYQKIYHNGRSHTVISTDFRKTLNDLERIRFDIFQNRLCIKDC